MSFYESLKGTTQNIFKIAKASLDATNLTAPRTITLPNDSIDFNTASTGQVLTKTVSGIKFQAGGGGGMTDPMTTAGDMIIRNVSNVTDRLGIGSESQALVVDSLGIPVWRTIQNSGAGGNGVVLYLDDTASDIPTYFSLLVAPSTASEQDDNTSLTSSASPKLIEAYATPSVGLNASFINAGVWTFSTWANVSGGATCTVRIDVYKRTSGGTETLLFTVSTPILTTTVTLYEIETVQPSFAINTTDRLVLKYNATNSSGSSRTVHYYHNGSTHYSHVHTPFIAAHNDLNGLQGGDSTNRWHGTQAEHDSVANGKLPQKWLTATSYVVDSVVWLPADNKIYRCITPNSDVTFTPANWQEISASASGNGFPIWVSATSYAVNNVVWLQADNKIYRCITPNSDVTFTPANWVELSPSVLGEPVTFTQNVTFQQASIAALSIDWAAKGYLYKTISADSTFTFANAADGKQITLYIQNTDTADHAVTMPTCKWAGGDALGISVKASHYNVYTFLQINGVLFASVNENMY